MSPFIRMSAATAALLAGFALAAPAFAADAPVTQDPQAKAQHHRHHNKGLETRSKAGVEGRIADLHAKFRITKEQEPQWAQFAQVMRDNTKSYDELAKTRGEKMKAMNAVQDLQSFEQIAQAHADGLKRLTASFQTLYDSFTPEQKKTADSVFHSYGERPMKKAQKAS